MLQQVKVSSFAITLLLIEYFQNLLLKLMYFTLSPNNTMCTY